MDLKLTDLSFEDWILFVFCWPAPPSSEPSYGHRWLTDEYWEGPPAVTVNYLTRLFEAPTQVLADFSDGEIAQGLWDILGEGQYSSLLADVSVPLVDRCRCLEAIAVLFRDLFAVRCTPPLGHRSEVGNPLNGVCYLWWDLFWVTPAAAESTVIFAAIVRSLTTILYLPSLACQEAALHGCGHLLNIDKGAIQAAIDRWLQHHPDLCPELRTYALSICTRVWCIAARMHPTLDMVHRRLQTCIRTSSPTASCKYSQALPPFTAISTQP